MEATVIEKNVTRRQAESGKYLTFALGDEEYGVEILKVREIIGVLEITSVPNMPGYVKGVINLRGNVIPVVDLRLKFGLAPREYDKQTCVIVIDIDGRQVGVVVDTVREVLDIAEENIDEPPAFGSAVDSRFILGMGKIGERVKILLDLDHVISLDGLAAAAQVAA